MDLLVALICAFAVVVQPNVEPARKTVRIQVDPYTTRQIEGVSELDRKKYFNLSDHGVKFDSRVRDKKILKRIVKDLDIKFWTKFRACRSATANGEIVNEDPARPTFANLDEFIAHLKTKQEIPSRDMRKWFGNNLGVAAHGAKNAYPEFMGRYFTDQARKDPHAHSIPENIEAPPSWRRRCSSTGSTILTVLRSSNQSMNRIGHISMIKNWPIGMWQPTRPSRQTKFQPQ